MTLGEWLTRSTDKLTQIDIESARLDCLILLEYIMRRNRVWCLANQNISLDAISLKKLNTLLEKRLKREPIAYIIGEKEFYDLKLRVTPDVLIPRPETETLIEYFQQLQPQPNWQVADIGTGSGAIALVIKHQFPGLEVTATDVSQKALDIASQNAVNHKLNIDFVHTDLLNDLGKFNVILANLPYVDHHWQTSPETAHEPAQALFANNRGLQLIYEIIDQAVDHLTPNGYLLLEHDPRQFQSISDYSDKRYIVANISPFTTALQLII